MRIFKRLHNEVSSPVTTDQHLVEAQGNQNQPQTYGWKQKLADKFWDNYLAMMGVMVCMVGLMPVIILSMQY